MLDRRHALAGLAAAPLAACATPRLAAGGAGASLDALAQRKGRRFGTAISSFPDGREAGSLQNPAYAAIVRRECGLVVPENEMKWQAIRPGPDAFSFDRMDEIAAFARANALELRGHTLLWHRPQWFPQWLNAYDFGANPVREAERLVTRHIDTVVGRYGGQIASWDVVNEAIDHERRTTIETSLSRAMGSPEAVLDLAFHTARAAAPKAQLVYNDYMSWEPQHAGHCADVLRLLEGFRKRGTPVDALGIQSHIEMLTLDPASGVGPYDEAGWRRFLDEVTGMGYRLLVTEFDVKDRALPTAIPARDAKVAEFAARYFELLFDYRAHLDDILAWGMVDRFNWLQDFKDSKRQDGAEVRGTPYDSTYRAKPLRAALADAFAAA